ncbi:unnamed protein product [Tenebrio molitor]|nr:unnamed protein product [Tenebrio molitor]
MFTRNGIFNTHTNHYWSTENSHFRHLTGHQQKFSINIWAGVLVFF